MVPVSARKSFQLSKMLFHRDVVSVRSVLVLVFIGLAEQNTDSNLTEWDIKSFKDGLHIGCIMVAHTHKVMI